MSSGDYTAGTGLRALVERVEAGDATEDEVRDGLALLFGDAPELGIATALGILSRGPRIKPSRGLVIDPAEHAYRCWRQRVAAGVALLAAPAAQGVADVVRDELSDDPQLLADVRLSMSGGADLP